MREKKKSRSYYFGLSNWKDDEAVYQNDKDRCKLEEVVHRNQAYGLEDAIFKITIKDPSEN